MPANGAPVGASAEASRLVGRWLLDDDFRELYASTFSLQPDLLYIKAQSKMDAYEALSVALSVLLNPTLFDAAARHAARSIGAEVGDCRRTLAATRDEYARVLRLMVH